MHKSNFIINYNIVVEKIEDEKGEFGMILQILGN